MLVAVGVILGGSIFGAKFNPLSDIPLIPAAPFLKYEPSGAVMLLASLILGPVAGSVTAALTCLIHWSTDGPIGVVMNLVASLAMVIPAGIAFKQLKKRRGGLVVSVVIGAVIMVAASIASNLVLTPLYMGVPREAVVAMILPALLPFNVVKAVLNAVFASILYVIVSRFLGARNQTEKK
jgi:riboflavin transporter FmnP